jgi:protein-tyrosine-phosphatase
MDATTVLFVCARNAGPSPMAEAYLNEVGGPHLRAFSAGLEPGVEVDGPALRTLQAAGLPVDGLAPKPLEVFAMPHAPRPDVVVTLARQPLTTPAPAWWPPKRHFIWSVADPGPGAGRAAFAVVFAALTDRIDRALADGTFTRMLQPEPVV